LTLVSTGMATAEEISDVVKIYKADRTSLVLLHTTSEYPASYLNANLEKILYLTSLNPEGLGYSDHTPDSMCSVMAVSYGCTYFEKHLTIDKSDPGPDHSASLNKAEFTSYVSEIHKASFALGEIAGTRSEKEDDMARTSRKSLHFARDLKAGAILELKDLVLLRPGYGLMWRKHPDVVGRSMLRDVKKFELISLNDLSSDGY
jgi:N,N'-diacetyllegionaminate synthase